jgi:hypothetical protein
MTWFAGVPLEIEVARARLIRAEQAIEDAQAANCPHYDSPEHSERPGSDWVASQVLELTRLQLLELRRVIEQILGVDRPIIDLEDVRALLRMRAAVLPEPDKNEAEYNVDSIVEGLVLLEALPPRSPLVTGSKSTAPSALPRDRSCPRFPPSVYEGATRGSLRMSRTASLALRPN